MLRISYVIAVGAVVGAVCVAPAGPVVAATNGTWTRIMTPSGTTTFAFNSVNPSVNHFAVSGETSPDVTSVDIVCMVNHAPVGAAFAAAVPVTGGVFSTVAALSGINLPCRLRAVPSEVDWTNVNAYLASYAGPLLYTNGIFYATAGATRVGFTATGEQGDGATIWSDAGKCGAAASFTVTPPAMNLSGALGSLLCAFTLLGWDVPTSGPFDASAVTVSGHNAYLPGGVNDYLNMAPQSLGLPQPALAIAFRRFSNGDVRVTESAPLLRCSVDDTYPPTLTSCPALVDTGVTFTRVSDIFRGAHQVRLRDTFASTDAHAHPITVQYESQYLPPPRTGAVGYTFPGGSTTFHRPSLGKTVTGLGSKAATMCVRSDFYSVEGDPSAGTYGLTWSRAPQNVHFSASIPDFFAMPYSLTVPAGGAAHLGFAYTGQVTTVDTKKLAAVAVAEMVNRPTVTSPGKGAVIKGHTTTVKGAVTLGANGLPNSVTVNGHSAKLTRVSASKATYTVSFRESFGQHAITVTATDVAGNTRSTSISVNNV